MSPQALLDKYPIISDQVSEHELLIILEALDDVLQRSVPGHVVEFGCYVGTTSLFLQRMLARGQGRELHVYDSFEGLPPKSQRDASPAGEQFTAGKLTASKKAFIKNFRQANLPMPKIHKGWFSEISQHEVPQPIALAFLDGDFYESIRDSLRLVAPNMCPGGYIIVDDYQSEALPGAKRAVDEFVRKTGYTTKVQASLCLIKVTD